MKGSTIRNQIDRPLRQRHVETHLGMLALKGRDQWHEPVDRGGRMSDEAQHAARFARLRRSVGLERFQIVQNPRATFIEMFRRLGERNLPRGSIE
jgi:hypothetical protein